MFGPKVIATSKYVNTAKLIAMTRQTGALKPDMGVKRRTPESPPHLPNLKGKQILGLQMY